MGWGINIGTTVQLYDKVKIGVALNEIGQIKYTGNVYEARDTRVWEMKTSGLENYNIFSQGQLITVDNPPNDLSFWQGSKNKSYSLPMSFRGGVSYRIIKQVEIGTDIFLPITKNVPGVYEKLVFGFGGKYAPADWVELSMGVVSGGKFGTNMPFGFGDKRDHNAKKAE